MADKAIANRIRAFRKLKGLTQQELSDRLGVSIAVLGSIERGTRTPKPELLQQIATVLRIDLAELKPIRED